MGCSITTKFKNKPISDGTDEKSSQVIEINVQPGTFVQENEHHFNNVYRLGQLISSGPLVMLHACFNRETSLKRVVKIYRKDLITNEASKFAIEQEISILKSLDHPNIVRMLEFFEEVKRIYLVMEYCKGGDLFTELLSRPSFDEQKSAQVMEQLFAAVAYMHEHHIMHRNLKPENILLEEKHEILSIKVHHFGSARNFYGKKLISGQVGTSYYMAPEVISGEYNEKCDLWSCGVILYILLSGKPPFAGKNNDEILEKVKTGVYSLEEDPWPLISASAKDLIRKLLCPQKRRISAQEAHSHSWIVRRSEILPPSEELIHLVLSNLKSFHSTNTLRDAVHTFITSQCLSSKDTKALREVFRAMDLNGDGRLSRQELLQQYSIVMSPAEAELEVNKIMSEVDTDNSGFIDYTEFLKASIDSRVMLSTENLRYAFHMFDKDGSGTISLTELKRALEAEASDDRVWAQVLDQVDKNGDGQIDIEEFTNIVLSKIE
ncbi:unnamed protein product [Blepharisma stoltei]|uniref:non-specific serine/threonine protein kinase n=1 Tax=Blepharisma stoltei TaxID=1481888 RepID=A0AAU9IWU1_9CILI|nr:unnamed protein product [Blepharisma stoltei]